LESFEADQAAGEVEQRLMGFGAAVVADVQPAVLVQPGEGALDDPAPAAKPGAMHGLAAGDEWGDAERADLSAVELLVVAAVSNKATRPAFRRAGSAAHGRYGVEQEQQLRAVVSVGAGQRPGERDAAPVGQQVVLRAATAPVDRARAGRGAPFFAWM
jgi:hypothetical protein